MAKIFLSYAREDGQRAKRVADALEAAGHDIWWDRDIGAGSSFSSDIETELENAELVVVLWSTHSIKSDWVRDEAAAGRDSGRLVPVLIDRIEPPLGFRQYQAVSLQGRRADHGVLLEAIDEKLGTAPKAPRAAASATASRWFHSRAILALVGILIALAGLGGWWMIGRSGAGGDTIAVVPSDDGGASRALARSIARDLAHFRAGPLGRMTIVEDEKSAGRAAFRVEVATSSEGAERSATVALKEIGQAALLWSSVTDVSGGSDSDLRQQVTSSVGQVLTCLSELGPFRSSAKGEVLSLYLIGCGEESRGEALEIFQRLTTKAPGFGPGWAYLAFLTAQQVPISPESEIPGLVVQARKARDQAKKLSPDFPETALADALVAPGGGQKFSRALTILDAAIQRNPDSPNLHATRGQMLQMLGRMRDSARATRRALDLNPLSASLFDDWVSALAYSGQAEAAYAELEKAEKTWPDSERLADARFRLDLRFGDPRRALAYLQQSNAPYQGRILSDVRAFAAARSDPSPQAHEAALRHLRESYRIDNAYIHLYLQALVTFGRIDEAYAALASPAAIDSLASGPDIIFRPYMAEFRADRRFIPFVSRLGLIEAWKRTGIWADFCSDVGLPYNCRAEAEKLGGGVPKTA